MGEAWFMGVKRRMFNELMTDSPDHWTPDVLRQPLYELASGPGSFGHLPEWTAWTHFLLAQLPTRIDGPSWASIYECLISAFIAHYPDERAAGPYEGFYADVLATVGRIPMSAGNWLDGGLAERGIISSIEKMPNGPCISSGGAFSAALFLHLKYLDPGRYRRLALFSFCDSRLHVANQISFVDGRLFLHSAWIRPAQ
jgi:hypothetical protein